MSVFEQFVDILVFQLRLKLIFYNWIAVEQGRQSFDIILDLTRLKKYYGVIKVRVLDHSWGSRYCISFLNILFSNIFLWVCELMIHPSIIINEYI